MDQNPSATPAVGQVRNTTFAAYRSLKRRLGSTTALAALNHVAFVEFQRLAGDSGTVTFVRESAKRHGIDANFPVFPDARTRFSQQFIVMLHQQWEHFLEDFKQEWRKLTGNSYPESEKLDFLRLTLQAVNVDESDSSIGLHRMALMDFFRIVRNRTVHSQQVDKRKDHKRSLDQLVLYRDQILHEFGRVPSDYDDFAVDDVLLYSRLILQVAFSICLLCRPPAERIAALMREGGQLKRFQKIANNDSRYRNAINGAIRTQFGLDRDEASKVVELMLTSSK